MVVTHSFTLSTQGKGHLIDITSSVAEAVGQAGVRDGIVTVFVTGSTAGVGTIEYETGLLHDFQEMWQHIAPQGGPYQHNRGGSEDNGHSHLQATLLGASLTIPFSEGKMVLGTWQQIILADFDTRPRRREIVLHIMGE